jgi:hypothetical protein
MQIGLRHSIGYSWAVEKYCFRFSTCNPEPIKTGLIRAGSVDVESGSSGATYDSSILLTDLEGDSGDADLGVLTDLGEDVNNGGRGKSSFITRRKEALRGVFGF